MSAEHTHTAPAPPAPLIPMRARLWAEFLGTFWAVLGGCGAAVLAAKVIDGDGVQMGIGFLGVALAFGLTVVTGAYALGHISGGHFNPAVTLGALCGGRIEGRAVAPYMLVQVIGGAIAATVIYIVASGQEDLPSTPPPRDPSRRTGSVTCHRAATACSPASSSRSSSPPSSCG